jgi:deoxycytidylate deaminase
MVAKPARIEFPELFFGFVAPIGADITVCVAEFREYLKGAGYNVVELKVTDIFPLLSAHLRPSKPLKQKPLAERYDTHISYGNQIREQFDDDAALAAITITSLVRERLKRKTGFKKNAYLLHQFKRPEEIQLLRSVYGRLFFQVSIYSRRGARVEYLSQKFAADANAGNATAFRGQAEEIISRDENESDQPHGQRVSKIFHDAEFIINTDINVPLVPEQIKRFCDLLFGSNGISPTKAEYGMFVAKAAALRALDLSRQVGAAIFTPDMEIVSMGCNEVPKAGGGTYWCDDPHDDREFRRGIDSNDKRKREILADILSRISPGTDVDDFLQKKEVQDSHLMDALEYGRMVHAESSAISDAARLGRATKKAWLYCTTFPCHMCAKQIVACGIDKVIFLEPYPKSLASDLHGDSILVEGADRGHYDGFPHVEFSHFHGVSPRRYREFFEREKRKNADGSYKLWVQGDRQPIIDIKIPFYSELEANVLRVEIESYLSKVSINREALGIALTS